MGQKSTVVEHWEIVFLGVMVSTVERVPGLRVSTVPSPVFPNSEDLVLEEG